MQRILVVLVMFSLPFISFSEKKSWLWFVLRRNSKRECRKWRETVTDLEWLPRTRSVGFVVKCSCTPNPLLKGAEECPC